ncbi:MAG TPA: lytic transglycosylase domain-containing protein [Flavisolibacter sp.]|jgi:membrane-bound lytic murein transglycosylase D|nr:lytic transglycosylase domain-containing protein [Flavisolibacter sp.]
MLKRKLVKAGFFGHGILFAFASPYSVSLTGEVNSYPTQLTSVVSYQAHGRSDTAIRQAVDSTFVSPDTLETKSPSIQLNAAASKFAKQYVKKNEEDLELIAKKSTPYFKIIESVFEKYDLPVELKYLAVVESELKASALSHVGAKGPWQLMAQTGRDFGLKITKKTDERTNYYKSTIAAAKYLKALHHEFGDWLLVLAAYNSGSGTVMKAIKRSGSRNFWKLQGFLPLETRLHVKRFIGVHHYFQEDYSLTVLTKAETAAYLKELDSFQESKKTIRLQSDNSSAALTTAFEK